MDIPQEPWSFLVLLPFYKLFDPIFMPGVIIAIYVMRKKEINGVLSIFIKPLIIVVPIGFLSALVSEIFTRQALYLRTIEYSIAIILICAVQAYFLGVIFNIVRYFEYDNIEKIINLFRSHKMKKYTSILLNSLIFLFYSILLVNEFGSRSPEILPLLIVISIHLFTIYTLFSYNEVNDFSIITMYLKRKKIEQKRKLDEIINK